MADEPTQDTAPENDASTNTDTGDTGTSSNTTLLADTAPPLVGPDGKFTENWRQALPEDIRDEPMWETVQDLPNMAKQFVNQRKAIGKNKIVVPDEKSKPEDWNAFYDALGRPKTADDYKVDIPKELSDVFTDDRVKAAKQRAHQLGITDKQFAEYMQGEITEAARQVEQQAQQRQQERQNAEQALRQEFGGAYEQRMHVANRLITEAMPNEEERMAFLERYGNDPTIIRLASTVGSRLTESKAMVAELTQKTPQEAQKRIRELQNTPGYLSPGGQYQTPEGRRENLSAEQRESITNEIRELYKQINPAPEVQRSFVGMGR